MQTTKATSIKHKDFLDFYLEVFPAVARYVKSKGGSRENAEDIFQESLVIYYEKQISNMGMSNHSAYIFGISRKLWLKHHQSTKRIKLTNNLPDKAEEKHKEMVVEKLLDMVSTAGEKCLNMLKAFYYDKKPMEYIAYKFGFTSVRSATVQKYKCIEKIRGKMNEGKFTYESFFE